MAGAARCLQPVAVEAVEAPCQGQGAAVEEALLGHHSLALAGEAAARHLEPQSAWAEGEEAAAQEGLKLTVLGLANQKSPAWGQLVSSHSEEKPLYHPLPIAGEGAPWYRRGWRPAGPH